MLNGSTEHCAMTVGLDISDRYSYVCMLDTASGEVVEDGRVQTTPAGLLRRFASEESMRIALETGTHSPWVSRLLADAGHEVIVADARQLRLIFGSKQKRDALDAEQLARLARVDPHLLHPIAHRQFETQTDLALLRSRDVLVQTRTRLINHVRGLVKSFGARLPKCSATTFPGRVALAIPVELRPATDTLLATIEGLTTQIQAYDRAIDRLAAEHYPETTTLRQVSGVGALTALAFVLVLEDPARFADGRQVGAYLGLTPSSRQSGASDPPQRITKRGDRLLRRLLVQSAQYILGPFGPDSDLRRCGQQLISRGGRYAKDKAVIAVARKLAVLLYHLWKTGDVYDPLYASRRWGRTAA